MARSIQVLATASRGIRKGGIVDFETAMKCVHERWSMPNKKVTL
jgi:cell division ATPase FtsA